MKKVLKEKWIEKLIDGSYEQAQEFLCLQSGEQRKFCCLGVLCDILGEKWTQCPNSNSFAIRFDPDKDLRIEEIYECTPPSDIEEMIDPDNKGLVNILVRMNDTEEKNFKEIAEYIKINVKED